MVGGADVAFHVALQRMAVSEVFPPGCNVAAAHKRNQQGFNKYSEKWQRPYDFKKNRISAVFILSATFPVSERLRSEHQFLRFIFPGMDLVSDHRDCPDCFASIRVRGIASRTKYGSINCNLSLSRVAVDVRFLAGAFSQLTLWLILKTHFGCGSPAGCLASPSSFAAWQW